MKYEILEKDEYQALEEFLKNHDNSQIYQSSIWLKMRQNKNEIIVVKDENEKIIASASIFVVNKMGKNLLFCPRGPVLTNNDLEAFDCIYEGIKFIAKKYSAYAVRMDPFIKQDDTEFAKNIQSKGGSILFVDDKEINTSPSHVVYILNIKDKTPEEIFNNFDSSYRYKIRRSAKRGIELVEGTAESLPEFHKLLSETTKRKKFNGKPLSYFEKIFKTLHKDNYRLLLAYFEGELIAATFLLCYGKTAIYLYGASSEKHREFMPNHLIQFNNIVWAKEHGFEVYSFGGIPGYNDENNEAYGIYRFKKGFSGEVVCYIGEINFVYKRFSYFLREKLIPFLRKLK